MPLFSKAEDSRQQLFRELYEAYYAPLCVYADRIVRDMAVSEDIVADIFVVLWHKMPEMELRSETSCAYLRNAVRNRCLNHLKHRLCELGYSETVSLQEPVYAPAPDTLYTSEELRELLHRTLERLPENYRTVFIRSVFEGQTYEQIAEQMQVSVKSVNRYKQRAVEQLRLELGRYLVLLMAAGYLPMDL